MQYTKAMLNKLKEVKNNVVDTTNKSHFRKQHTDLENTGLNPTQIIMLNYIYDTMELSWTKHDQYYDKKRHNYYAIVTRQRMYELYRIKDSAVGNNLQFLEDAGYIQKVHNFNGGVKVFVRHFNKCNDTPKSNVTKSQNSLPSHTHSNHTNSTSDTEHTSSSQLNTDDKLMKMIKTAVKQLKGNQTSQAVQENTINDNKDDKHLNYATLGTKAMPEKANHSINIIANSLYPKNVKKRYKFIHDINGMIFKFKSAIFKKHDLYEQSRWENNETLTNQFNTSIYEMLYNAFSGQREVDNGYAYFGGALRKFFTKIVNQLLGKHTESTQHFSKQKKTSVKGNHRIHEKLPDWARDGYNPKFHKISKSKKQAIQDRLKRLDTKLG